jgi:hypothetical protein
MLLAGGKIICDFFTFTPVFAADFVSVFFDCALATLIIFSFTNSLTLCIPNKTWLSQKF